MRMLRTGILVIALGATYWLVRDRDAKAATKDLFRFFCVLCGLDWPRKIQPAHSSAANPRRRHDRRVIPHLDETQIYQGPKIVVLDRRQF